MKEEIKDWQDVAKEDKSFVPIFKKHRKAIDDILYDLSTYKGSYIRYCTAFGEIVFMPNRA